MCVAECLWVANFKRETAGLPDPIKVEELKYFGLIRHSVKRV